MTPTVDSVWTTQQLAATFLGNSWINRYPRNGWSGNVCLARRGHGPKAVSQMQISGADYGPTVPSSVFVS